MTYDTSDDNTALINGRKHTWKNANPSKIRLEFSELAVDQSVGITIPWAGATLKAKGNISGWGEMTASGSVAEVDAGTGNRFFWNQSVKTIHFKAAFNATVGETHAYYFEPR